MALDAAELGLEGTVQALRQLLVDHFGFAGGPQAVTTDSSLFAIGLGLSSLDGIEFLCAVEKRFGVRVNDLDWWVYETPTLDNVAAHLIELTKKQHVTPQ